MLICSLLSTYTIMANRYYGKIAFPNIPNEGKKLLTVDDWSYNPYDVYESKLELIIIIVCGFVTMLMMVDILMICLIHRKNINTRKDKDNKCQ